jgi:hypothetical protein
MAVKRKRTGKAGAKTRGNHGKLAKAAKTRAGKAAAKAKKPAKSRGKR